MSAVQTKTSTPAAAKARSSTPSRGQAAAALIGGTLLSFAMGVAITIFVPGQSGLDQALLGGFLLVFIWPLVMLWVLFAPTTGKSWLRALIPTVLFIALNAAGMLL
ncbi:MAG: hypothetical protein AAGD01_05480 [Acidobacteriota bacterium]